MYLEGRRGFMKLMMALETSRPVMNWYRGSFLSWEKPPSSSLVQ